MNIFYELKAVFDNDSKFLKEKISHQDFIKNMPLLLKKYKALHLRPNLENFDESKFAQILIGEELI